MIRKCYCGCRYFKYDIPLNPEKNGNDTNDDAYKKK